MFDRQLSMNGAYADYLRNAQQAQSAHSNTFIGYATGLDLLYGMANAETQQLRKETQNPKVIISKKNNHENYGDSFLPNFVEEKSFLP
ncbi:MAG TPA: hypothetical protein VHZ76_00850 [Gammaproteobacteria bacterium]|jgi:hypothetical protein|nr:hypothetical protein [Gammaproteobacteria bacterium]